VAAGWTVGVRSPAVAIGVSLSHSIQTGPEAHQASYLMSTGGLSLGVKPPRREAHYLPPSSAEVKVD
jgi:hypothetical protein